MKKAFFTFLTILIFSFLAFSYDDDDNKEDDNNKFYNAFISGDIKQCEKELKELFTADEKEEYSDSSQLKKLEYAFGYIGWCLNESANNDAKHWLGRFKEILDNNNTSDVKNRCDIDIYKNAFLCYSILIENKSSALNGSKAYFRTKDLIEKNPDNYLAKILMSKIVLNMPKSLGGSRKKAISYLKQAILLMEGIGEDSNNWMYINSLIDIADLYRQESDFLSSETYINKLLLKEPSISSDVIKTIRGK